MPDVELANESWGARVTFNRPPVNALSTALLCEFADVLEELSRKQPNLMVLTGAGSCFSAGADLKEHYRTGADAWNRLQTGQRILDLLRAVPFPTVAAVNGVCLGGAMNIIANCDLRVARAGAAFGNPEIKRGRVGGTSNLRGLMSEGDVRWLALTGDTMDAEDAHRAGLVQKVYPAEQWEDSVTKLAVQLSGHGGDALYLIKQGVKRTKNASPEDGQWIEQQLTYRLLIEAAQQKAGAGAVASGTGPGLHGSDEAAPA